MVVQDRLEAPPAFEVSCSWNHQKSFQQFGLGLLLLFTVHLEEIFLLLIVQCKKCRCKSSHLKTCNNKLTFLGVFIKRVNIIHAFSSVESSVVVTTEEV